ncbi:hypothetical protein PanWU01x14_001210, partial [Parasponia andersonii]
SLSVNDSRQQHWFKIPLIQRSLNSLQLKYSRISPAHTKIYQTFSGELFSKSLQETIHHRNWAELHQEEALYLLLHISGKSSFWETAEKKPIRGCLYSAHQGIILSIRNVKCRQKRL